jgi:hypothetical protein
MGNADVLLNLDLYLSLTLLEIGLNSLVQHVLVLSVTNTFVSIDFNWFLFGSLGSCFGAIVLNILLLLSQHEHVWLQVHFRRLHGGDLLLHRVWHWHQQIDALGRDEYSN